MKAEKKGADLVLVPDAFNEQVILAAAMIGDEFRAYAVRHTSDVFHVPLHRAAWSAIIAAQKQGLKPDPATLSRLSNGGVDVNYLVEVLASRPDLPAEANLKAALDALLWDHKKHEVLTGPLNAMLDAVTSGADAPRVQSLARAVAASLDGWGERKHLHDPEEIVREVVADIRESMAGRHVYPFGLRGLDYYDVPPGQDESRAQRRLVPGAAPGMVTIITGLRGAGKSTVAARLTLGLARQKRRVLYGAWEMTGWITLKLLACMSIGLSRKKVALGEVTEEELANIETTARAISKYVRFLKNPFRRTIGERHASNDKNLDLVHGYLADVAPDVFVGDLWERCLVADEPSEEKRALFRQQAMCEELGVHGILLAQQRKDVAARGDMHPTIEGIKGSGAWGEIADNVLGVYRQYQAKPVPDNTIEIDVLKQRYGSDMLAVEFDWDADRGMISGGRTIEYERPGSAQSNSNPLDAKIREPKAKR